MSSQSVSLRSIPADVVAIADAIAQQTGLALSDVYRLALTSGVLIEATKITPDRAGTYAGLDGVSLAKALRRHLSSAIDLLLASGEHPAAARLVIGTEASAADQTKARSEMSPDDTPEATPFDPSLGEDLESLGIGLGLSQQHES